MTIFGYDISSYQHGTDVTTLGGDFVLLKCTEGVTYADADYPRWAPAAHGAGKLVMAYHYLRSGSSPLSQAQWLASHIGNPALPVMLDVEDGSGGLDLVLQTVDTMRGVGLNPRLVYLPEWYWAEIGSPSLTGLAARGIGLVSSNYPMRTAEYPGDSGPGWAPYGDVRPMVWQFTDTPLDNNAYSGSLEELRNFLTGAEMNLTDTVTVSGGFAARYPATGPDGFTAGAAVSVATLLEGAAIRAVNNEHLLSQVLAKMTGPATVDVNALAAALVPHLPVGGDPEAVALAVVSHLGLQVVAK